MPELTLAEWDAFLHQHSDFHFLQTGEWGELKLSFDWDVARVVNGNMGAQNSLS